MGRQALWASGERAGIEGLWRGLRRAAALLGAALALSGCVHLRAQQAPTQPVSVAMRVAAPVTPVSDKFTPAKKLEVCRGFSRRNLPKLGRSREILRYKPFAKVRGVVLATAPANHVCVTSGFGRRWGRLHKGVDLAPSRATEAPLPIFAAGDGVIREMRYYRGYGRSLVIDHGDGVFTRYAHLSSFGQGLREGLAVKFGRMIGRMGRSGRRGMGVHLHYEVLTGDYKKARLAFALKGRDPLRLKGVDRNAPIQFAGRVGQTRPAAADRAPSSPPGPGRARQVMYLWGASRGEWRKNDA